LRAERQVLVKLGIRRRMLGTHLRPVGIHLLGNERRQAGERTLSKLDVLDEHRDGIVDANPHKRIGDERGRAASRGDRTGLLGERRNGSATPMTTRHTAQGRTA
jgi:hypothetical protein